MSAFAGNTSGAPGWTLPVLCVAQFVVVLDATIVTTALPAIRQALGFSQAGLQWVVGCTEKFCREVTDGI